MLNILVTNLGKYNEGELIGEWLELPAAESEIQKTFDNIGINEEYEEFFITDYDSGIENLKIGEYSNIAVLNELVEMLDNFNEEELKVFVVLLNTYNVEEAIEKILNGDYAIYYNCGSMEDVAYEIVQESGLLDGVPESVAVYFDYEAYGRDLELDANFQQINYDTYAVIY